MTPRLGSPRPAQERAFLQSVVYSAIFDYPLSVSQLREALIGEVADNRALLEWFEASPCLQRAVEYEDGYFFPRGRRDLLRTRGEREAISRALLTELASPLDVIVSLPFVRMVAISGSLAHLNAERGADLDLFVITRPHRVWITTVLALAVSRLLGWRARLCLNYVVSERALWIQPADLFSANQIVHLQPIVGETVYRKFLDANHFVERFYPNFEPRAPVRVDAGRSWLEPLLDWTIAPLAEPACRWLYRTHLRRRAHTWPSRDQVRLEAECLKLHTHSHRHHVMEQFERALEEAVEGQVCHSAAGRPLHNHAM